MSILLKITSNDSRDDHASFPDSQYENALIVMQSWARQPETESCVLYLMSDDPDLYSSDWVEIDRTQLRSHP